MYKIDIIPLGESLVHYHIEHPKASFRATKDVLCKEIPQVGETFTLPNGVPVKVTGIFIHNEHYKELNCNIVNASKYTKAKCEKMFKEPEWNIYG